MQQKGTWKKTIHFSPIHTLLCFSVLAEDRNSVTPTSLSARFGVKR